MAGVAASLARRVGGVVVPPSTLGAPDVDIDQLLVTAGDLERDGQLDDAITTYDAALEAAAQSPFAVERGQAWIDAAVARASLALARGEPERADALMGTVVTLDGDFELTPAEARPSMRDALARARARLGRTPSLAARHLGRACQAGIDVVVVARALPAGGTELVRFDGCRVRARAEISSAGATDDAIADLLLGLPTAATSAGSKRSAAPFYRRPLFWVGVAAASAAAATAGYFLLRPDEDGYDVALHW